MKQSMASAAALLCAGCALGVPAGVRVKTAPTIRVPSGGATTELDEYLSADILKGNPPNADIYQYGKDNTLHFLVRYRINEKTLFEEARQEYLNDPDWEKYGNIIPPFEAKGLIEAVLDGMTPIKNINLSDFAQALPGNLGFESVTARIYARLNDKPLSLSFKPDGGVYADCWKEHNEQSTDDDKQPILLLGGNSNTDPAEILPPFPVNPHNVLSAADIYEYAQCQPSLGDIELEEVFNEFPERFDIRFEDISSEEITFTSDEIETMDSLQLYIDMVLDISLAFVAADPDKPAVICLDDIPGIDADSWRKTTEENNSLFESVQAVTLRLSYDNSLLGSDTETKIRVKDSGGSKDICTFALKTGPKQTSEVVLDAGYVQKLPKLEDIELAFTPVKDDPARTLFSFSPGEDGTGGAFTLRGIEVETSLDCTFHF
jgi:hypothetical protein